MEMSKQELKEWLEKTPRRPKEEIFQELVGDMKKLSETPMSDGEAADAARNLIGFFNWLIEAERVQKLRDK